MKKEYDFSKMKSRKNPYARKLKRQITLRLDPDVIEYFKDMSARHNLPYQSIINLYLTDCMTAHRQLKMNWPASLNR